MEHMELQEKIVDAIGEDVALYVFDAIIDNNVQASTEVRLAAQKFFFGCRRVVTNKLYWDLIRQRKNV